ncbi:hypothetical protein OR62_08630 [Clostridium tetani]|uniref:Uncharacterized protein n=1 Tax=Clostridium tetani TaxID=1513 RepID=A0ABY0ET68_CLOTA|nr:hypothetical protein [Clostridium tetani]KHO38929.1 hypothetical protein OR62_08630 [Clostridium tetani]RXI56723.1 hypothetical protein DP131_06720 [Clostridium tetani]RXI65914.1 hypothetical protein DQN76_14270 [Clostridium tetani]
MTVLQRLKIELNNKDYFTDNTYIMYLQENNLDFATEYNKKDMQKDLLLTVIDILEAVANDVDLMRQVEDNTVGLTTTEAYKLLKQRIQDIKERIASIPISEESFSNVSLLFTRNR